MDFGREILILCFYWVWGLAFHVIAHRVANQANAWLARHHYAARIASPVNVEALKHYAAHIVVGFIIFH